MLLITHRVAAASQCDAIIVLDDGRVVERGHARRARVAEGGLYAVFAEEQRVARELDALEASGAAVAE